MEFCKMEIRPKIANTPDDEKCSVGIKTLFQSFPKERSGLETGGNIFCPASWMGSNTLLGGRYRLVKQTELCF